MAIDKAEMLGAIAAGGSRAKAAYEQAHAALQSGQSEAIKMALAGSVAQNAPAGLTGQLSATIAQPYQNQSAALTANQAYSDDYYEQLGTGAGTYMDQASALIPAIEKQWEERLAYEMALRDAEAAAGGGGGGGSGGSAEDWWDPLSGEFDTKSNLYSTIDAIGRNGQIPVNLLRAEAARAYGIPEGVIQGQGWVPSGWLTGAADWLEQNQPSYKEAVKYLNKQNAKTAGGQATNVQFLLNQMYGKSPSKKKLKKHN